jgi:carboxyl-terminal processing protease
MGCASQYGWKYKINILSAFRIDHLSRVVNSVLIKKREIKLFVHPIILLYLQIERYALHLTFFMNKFLLFMKSTKGIILLSLCLVGIGFCAFSSSNNKPPTKNEKLLTLIAEILEKTHYSPQNINDGFSKKVFLKFLNEIDGDKCLFIKSDIESLSKYETMIDDEMKGKVEEFLPALNIIYDKRLDEQIKMYKQILSVPFDYTIDENIVVESEKMPFAANEKEREDRLKKKLKAMALDRYIDLLDQKEKSVIDSIKNKPNSVLEVEARAKVTKAIDKVYTRLKVKFTADERFNAFVNVITNIMDPHTDYFPPVEKRAFDEMMSGRFYGIGAQLQEQDGNIKIATLVPSYPAQRCGELVVNDIIVKVAQGTGEAVEITGYDITDAVKLIRGAKDTEVRLTIKKQDGTTKIVVLKRAEIVQDEAFVRSAIVTQNGEKIGYIHLQDFYANFEDPNGARCSQDVAKEIIKLKAQDVKGIVLDLRYNGGGSLYEVKQMVGQFIAKGPVVQVRDKDGKATVLDNNNASTLYDGPLVVMINEGSASASEIFAAAIQDYKRGIIVGSTSSFGKGTVQRTLPLSQQGDIFSQNSQPDLGVLKLTFQKFYRVNGGSTQLKGVNSDIVLPDVLEYLKIREKDNTASLSWDEIPKANYTPWKFSNNTTEVINKTNAAIANNATFKLLKDNTTWLSHKTDAPRSLMLTKYKDFQKQVSSTVTQNYSLLKLKDSTFGVEVLKDDYNKFYNNADKPKGERYQAWLKSLKEDLYISETMKIMSSLIESYKLNPVSYNK